MATQDDKEVALPKEASASIVGQSKMYLVRLHQNLAPAKKGSRADRIAARRNENSASSKELALWIQENLADQEVEIIQAAGALPYAIVRGAADVPAKLEAAPQVDHVVEDEEINIVAPATDASGD